MKEKTLELSTHSTRFQGLTVSGPDGQGEFEFDHEVDDYGSWSGGTRDVQFWLSREECLKLAHFLLTQCEKTE